MNTAVQHLHPSARVAGSLSFLGRKAPKDLTCLGPPELLERPSLGFLCSARCPGDILLAAYEVSKRLDPAGPVVIGGFHSPMERQFLEILLVRLVPAVACVPRPLQGMRIGPAWRAAIGEGRLLVVSPLSSGSRRFSRAAAEMRNATVGALADSLFIPYAFPGGSVERLLPVCAGWGKQLLTVACNDQWVLRAAGAQSIEGWIAGRGEGAGVKSLVLL